MNENPATRQFICQHAHDDVRALALRTPPPGVDLPWALQQIQGRQLAERKLPQWAACADLWWPVRLSMEQASSQPSAAYKRQLAARLLPEPDRRRQFIDLTGGLGVDFATIAPLFQRALHVERNPELSTIVAHNLPLLGLNHAETQCADAETIATLLAHADLVMLDPARRDTAGRKTVCIEDCTPDVRQLLPSLLPNIGFLMLKLSPMLDVTAALRSLPQTCQVHVVTVDGECKELLLVLSGALASPSPTPLSVHAIGLRHDQSEPVFSFVFQPQEEQQAQPVYATHPQQWLLEPDPAVLKAAPLKLLCQRYQVQKLAPMSHLYTSPVPVPHWPGRLFRVESTYTFGKQDLRALLADTPRADLTVRGFPQSVAQLRARLKIKEGGTAHLFATTLADGQKIIIKTVPEA